ncbi:MAG: Hsp20/alpha crystallin family protein [Ignavibacteriaceae bacterium]
MTLIKYEPFRELENFDDKIQSLLNTFPDLNSEYEDSFYPKIDISEDEKNIYVDSELPGIKKNDIKITLNDNILTISGEKKNERKEKDLSFFRTERVYGVFSRSFTIPGEINPDTIDAKFEDGILKMVIEKINDKKISGKLINIK